MLQVALHMREAVGYLAALASRSDLEVIARKLLGVHVDLGAEIAALMDADDATPASQPPGPRLIRH